MIVVEIFGIVITAILGFVSKIGLDKYHARQNKKNKPKIRKRNINLTANVSREISKAREHWQSSRVYVSLLHNGSKFALKGLHYDKLSVVFEQVDHLTPPSYGVVMDYPVLQFSPLIASLDEDGRHHRSYHDEPEGSESKTYMEQNSIKDEFMVPIRNNNDIIVGIVGASFHTVRAVWSEEEWMRLEKLAEGVRLSLEQVAETGGSQVIEWN